jgi:hypothetical protein
MSSEMYLYFDGAEPAGKVDDILELSAWVRKHGPAGPALEALLEHDQTVSAVELERDLLQCFLRADDWPAEAEQLLEAVLGRLFDDRRIGVEFERELAEDEELPKFDASCQLICRLADHAVAADPSWWQDERLRERALLLLWIAERLLERPEPFDALLDDEEQNRRIKLVAALAKLSHA